MKNNKWYGCVLAVGVAALGASQAVAQPEVVYENIANPDIANGFAGFDEGGNQITLAGEARIITRLELAIVAGSGTIPVVVRLYVNDGESTPLGAAPGTLLFESGTIGVEVTSADGFATFSVVVPNILVPDTITWTIQRVDGTGFSMRRFDPPSVGSDAGFVWERPGDGAWSPNAHGRMGFNAFYAIVEAETDADPIKLLTDLIQKVMELNLKNGISNSLDGKLDASLNALDDMNVNNDGAAINALGAFINHVTAQSGNSIPMPDADDLIADAQAIIDLLLES